MPHQPDDLRVRRTRHLLRTALIELIEERGFEKATVGEISERAMISRASFYRNYRDKYQLVEEVFDEAVDALRGTMADEQVPVEERLVAFFEHLADYERLYGALLGESGSSWFASRMRATLAEMAKGHLPAAPSSPTSRRGKHSDLLPTLLSATYVEIITWWLANHRPMSAREMAQRSSTITAAIISANGGWTVRRPGGQPRH